MIIIEHSGVNLDWPAIITAGSTLLLAGITFFYARQTRKTVKIMQKQMDEKRREDKQREAIAIIEEIANRGILTISAIINAKRFNETEQNIEAMREILFNKYSYIIDEKKMDEMFELYSTLHNKLNMAPDVFKQEKEKRYYELHHILYFYFWELRKKAISNCLQDSIFLNDIERKKEEILKNGQT